MLMDKFCAMSFFSDYFSKCWLTKLHGNQLIPFIVVFGIAQHHLLCCLFLLAKFTFNYSVMYV